VLDAAECPPTFGTPAALVVAHLAGPEAMLLAAEGAEDDEALGRGDVIRAGIGPDDAVLAVAASGRTPYAIGALRGSARRGAFTAAPVRNRPTPMHAEAGRDDRSRRRRRGAFGLDPPQVRHRPELVLDMVSTGAMIRIGRTYGNLMVGVQSTNVKLRARAERLVAAIVGERPDIAGALAACGHDVRVACTMLRFGLDADAARTRLDAAEGSLRRVLDGK
jgi:N-acetylmuramic acid 6-phosphate etherase